MSRNGSGTYTLPAGNPVVTGTTISSTWANSTLTNIASALTDSLAADGQTTATGNLKMGNNRITGLADGIAATDAASITQVTSAVAITGGTINGTTIGTTTRSSVKATTLDLGLSTQSVAIGQGDSSSLKNRIINGAMVIDQRNAGASVANIAGLSYSLDRWALSGSVATKFTVQQNAGSVTPPVGFVNYLGVTSSSAYTVGAAERFQVLQRVEGFNISDLGWGTANAKTVTLSFWVQSSLTGTFGGALQNSAVNRSYPYSYTISSANTWEQKSITIAGDTSGTWATDNTNGISVTFGLGTGSTYSGTAGAWATADYNNATGATSVVGTNGATFYITGVQLEVGSQATGFEYRQYQQELALCQRYYYRLKATAANYMFSAGGQCFGTTGALVNIPLPVTMRITPTAVEQNGTAADYIIWNATTSAVALSAVPAYSAITTNNMAGIDCTVASGVVAGNATQLLSTNSNAYLGWSAEL
jgi:hypothetical protein